jgi:hypothetical protein
VVVGGARKTKVGGRPRPLKVEIRTLRFPPIVTNVVPGNGNSNGNGDAIASENCGNCRARISSVSARKKTRVAMFIIRPLRQV